MGFADSFKKVIGLSDIKDDEIVTAEELVAEKKKIERNSDKERQFDYGTGYSSSTATSRAASYGGHRVSQDSARSMEKSFTDAGGNALKLILIEPKSYEDAQKLVDNLKARKPVIINLENLETDIARKIFDFLNGAVYALGGGVKKIANNIFIFTPHNVSVDGEQPQDFVLGAGGRGNWG